MSNRHRRNQLRRRRRTRQRYFESLEPRLMLAVDWRNPVNPYDVNRDMSVSPIDALIGINELNRVGPHTLTGRDANSDLPYLDVSGDNEISPIDVLQVFNLLNDGRGGEVFVISQREFVSEFEYQITLGQHQGSRHYRLAIDSIFETSDTTSSIDDVFNIYLIDPNDGATTLLDRGTPGTALFSKIGDRTELATGLVTFDGSIVDIDLSTLGDRDTGLLRLQHINGDSSAGGQVLVRPLSNIVDADGTPGTMIDFSSGLGALGGALNLVNHSPLVDANVEFSQIRFNSVTGLLETNLQIQSGGQSTGRNLAVTFPNLPNSIELLNRSGETTDGVPYINLRPTIADGGLKRGSRSRSVLLQFDNASRTRLDLTPVVLTGGENEAPVFDAVGDLRVMPGEKLSVALSATDPDGDRVTYSLRNDARLPNGTLKANGTLSFSPGPNDIGTYQFNLVASDGAASSEQAVTLQVAADPVTTTRVSGIILDVHQMPLAGMQVEIGAVQGLTMSDGKFTLDLGSGPLVSDTIKIRGELFPGPQTYPFIAEKLPLVLEHDVFTGVNNVIDRPIYLPALDMANGMTINPAQDTTVTTTAIPGASVMVAAGTLMNQQGTPFTGALSITEVPSDLTPAALPPNLMPDTVVTIQPGEMVFASPAPLSLPNSANLSPGVVLDLWSISPITGEFEIVGKGQVSQDGSVIETIEGGIRNSSWHMFGLGGDADDQSRLCLCEAEKQVGSSVGLFSGYYREDHTLPTYTSLGETRGVQLVYHSHRAAPNPVARFSVPLASSWLGPAGSNVSQYLTASLSVETAPGFRDQSLGGEHFWSLNGIATAADDFGAGIQVNLANQPSGAYNYELTVGLQQVRGPGPGATVGASTSLDSRIVSVNSVDSAFGAGWGLAGYQQIVENIDRSLLLIDGDGLEYLFDAPAEGETNYVSPAGDFSILQKLGDGTFIRTLPNQTAFVFSSSGYLTQVEDRLGHITRYEHTEEGQLLRIVDAADLATTFEYVDGRLARITDPADRVTQFAHDSEGNLIEIRDPDGSLRRWEYDAEHRMVTEVDKRGNRETTQYDEFGLIQSIQRQDGSSVAIQPASSLGLFSAIETGSRATAPPIDSRFSNIATYVDGRGNPEAFLMDSAGMLIGRSDSIGNLLTLVRRDDNLVQQVFDGRGNSRTLTYDDRGNVIASSDAFTLGGGAGSAGVFGHSLFAPTDRPSLFSEADLNLDGNIDIVTMNVLSKDFSVFLGQGNGNFIEHTRFIVGDDLRINEAFGDSLDAFAVRDLDLDGVPDFIAINYSSDEMYVALGVGDGTFGSHSRVGTPNGLLSVAVADVSGDGVPDLVTRHHTGIIAVHAGVGDGAFRLFDEYTTEFLPIDLQLVDLDGDGDLDIASRSEIRSGRKDQLYTFMNDGAGAFVASAPLEFDENVNHRTWISFQDITRDGVLDFMVFYPEATEIGTGRPKNQAELFFYPGQGNGTFGDVEYLRTFTDLDDSYKFARGDQVTPLQFNDLNGDGALDLVLADPIREQFLVFLTDETGELQEETAYPTFHPPTQIELIDVNGDQVIDIVSLGESEFTISVLLGQGNGMFEAVLPNAPPQVPVGANPHSVLVADINDDGNDDLITANKGSNDISIVLGLGNGLFGNETRMQVGQSPTDVTLGDFNSDGVPDLAVANSNSNFISIFEGLGAGVFGSERQISLPFLTAGIAAADIDGDGDDDLVVPAATRVESPISRLPYAGRAFLSNGDFTFAVRDMARPFFPPFPSGHITLTDVDMDGNVDVVMSGSECFGSITLCNTTFVLLGNGDGTFGQDGAIYRSHFVKRGSDIVVADISGDGALELITSAGVTVVHQSNPEGTFESTGIFWNGRFTSPVQLVVSAAADINGDGNLDIVTTDPLSDDVSVILGLGDGAFDFQKRFSTGLGSKPTDLAFGDFNGDGFVDLVTANSGLNSVSILYGGGEIGSQPTSRSASSASRSSSTIGTPRRTTYDPKFQQVTSSTDSLGRVVGYEIDPDSGNVQSIARPDNTSTKFTYTPQALVDTRIDPKQRVYDYDYNQRGRLTSLTIAQGTADEAVQRFEYDDAGNRTAFIDERQKRTEYEYDVMNRLTRIRNADGNETTFEYDMAGNITKTVDGRNNSVVNEFDKLNRLIKTIDENNEQTRFEYDLEGNVSRITNAVGNTTANEYDARNRLVLSTDARGGKTRYRYDLNDNLLSLTDSVGNTTQFQYDARDRLVAEIDPLGKRTTYSYDSENNLIEKVDRNGRTTSLAYDSLDRLVTEDWILPSNSVVANRINYAYDSNSNLTQVYDNFSALSYTYDERDRVVTVDNSLVTGSGSQLNTPMPSVLLTYAYDAAGNVSSVTDTIDGNAGATTVYGHDALDRVTSITQTGSNTSDKHVEFGYNELGQFISIERYAAQSDLATQLVAQSSYVYDDLNRLSMLDHTNRSGNRLNFFDFTFDASSRITSIEDMDGLTSFSYDRTDQLVAANRSAADPRGDESYSYDKNGNRINSHRHGSKYETGAGNRLLSDGTYNYEYDNEGNQILRTEIASGAKRAFEYDHRNRLVRVTDADGSGTPTQIVEYVYDALDRRIEKSVDDLTSGASPAEVTQFVYDREDIILQYEGDAGAATTLAHRNLHRQGFDQILAEDDGQKTVWMLSDHLGTVTDIVSSAGVVISHRTFDSFGNLLSRFDGSSYGYTGREYDTETGLMYYRARFVDLDLGRFIGEDRVGVVAGENPFEYVLNRPQTLVDPFGNQPELPVKGNGFVTRHPRFHFQPKHASPRGEILSEVSNFVKQQNQHIRKVGPMDRGHVKKAKAISNFLDNAVKKGSVSQKQSRFFKKSIDGLLKRQSKAVAKRCLVRLSAPVGAFATGYDVGELINDLFGDAISDALFPVFDAISGNDVSGRDDL